MKKIFTLFAALTCAISFFAATETVYFVNADNWTGTINAYAWTSSSNAPWPGTAATKEAEQLAGCDVYSYTAEAGTYANVIFNNGSKQTADLKWTAGKYFVRDGWYTKEEALVKLGQPVEYESGYFVNVDGWSNVKIYTWSPSLGDWPGIDMKKETETIGGKEVWSHTEIKGSSFGGVIFNNGSGTQTSDLTWNAGKYYVVDGWYTKEEAEEKLSGTTPPVETTYYVTGTANLVGAAWVANAVAMSNVDGVYTHTFTEVAANDTCKMKITDGTWDHNWGYSAVKDAPAGVGTDNDGNIVFMLAETGDVVVTFDGTNVTLAGDFYVSDEPVEVTYALMGVGGDWGTGIAMTINEDATSEEYVIKGQVISEGDAVKVVKLENGIKTHYCGAVEDGSAPVEYDADGNIVLAPGTYDFYYKVDADKVYIGTSTPSAVDEVVVNNQPLKFVHNGQLVVRHGDKLYNMLGQEVK